MLNIHVIKIFVLFYKFYVKDEQHLVDYEVDTVGDEGKGCWEYEGLYVCLRIFVEKNNDKKTSFYLLLLKG